MQSNSIPSAWACHLICSWRRAGRHGNNVSLHFVIIANALVPALCEVGSEGSAVSGASLLWFPETSWSSRGRMCRDRFENMQLTTAEAQESVQ